MKRILACLFVMAVLPLVASPTQNSTAHLVPFATVAFAGHSLVGGWCECGAPGCICDPGENPGGNMATPVTDKNESSDQGLSPIRAHSRSRFDFGTGTLLLALALFLWARLRA